MAHAIWKGQISFGLVSIPVALISAEDRSTAISFHQVDKRNGARIKYKRINVETEEEVPWEDIAKGYEYTEDNTFIVQKGELQRIAGENAKTIAIETFVDKDSINFIDIERTFYLEPDKKGDKGYVILREALASSHKIGIAKVIISTKEYLAAVSVYKDALVVYTLHYADEMRDVKDLAIPAKDLKKYKVSSKEIDIAKKLIQSMSSKWNPKAYKDEYKEAVQQWIEEKANNLPTSKMKSRAPKAERGKVVNFVDLLRKSIEKTGDGKRTLKKVAMRVPKRTSAARHATRH